MQNNLVAYLEYLSMSERLFSKRRALEGEGKGRKRKKDKKERVGVIKY